MHSRNLSRIVSGFLPLILIISLARVCLAQEESPQQRRGGRGGGQRGVYKSQITPNWFANNTRFWYRNDLRGGTKEFIVVDAVKGTRQPAFDHARLASALSKAVGQTYSPNRLPFSEITFSEDGNSVSFEVDDQTWKCDLKSYSVLKAPAAEARTVPREDVESEIEMASVELDEFIPGAAVPELFASQARAEQQEGQRRGNRGGGQGAGGGARRGQARSATSPDDKWTAFIRDHNVFVRPESGGDEIQLSTDGVEGNAYSRPEWSPDSKTLIAWRVEPGERKEVYLIESSPRGGGRAVLRQRAYPLPGDRFSKYEPNVFDVAARKQIKPDVDRFEHEWLAPNVRWLGNNRFAWQQVDRGHQRLRVIEVNCASGGARNLVDEKTETFIWTAHTENLNTPYVNWLEQSDEMIYVSEMDGWRHLYLVDTAAGKIKNQITKGEWVVRGIDRIDEEKRQVWFRAGGMNPDQDPYFVHHYRVNFDGTGLVALTEGNGTHTVQYSPDRKYLIDTYSRVDMPPMHELRRTEDGKLVCKLEEADITELKETGWEPPEVFVAKGRDGKTDIWGIICRPRNLDPNKKYPVLEQIYAGPHSAYVPKSFSGARRFASLTDLGFIVVQMDGMGTAFRSKAFHDVCWKNLKDAGFPDRILWHKAAAAKYSYYDITRVGLYGTSAGGQNAAGGVLFHPEFYKAASANCGCHDNRMDKASWNEQWMGYPVGPQYSECSNIDNAARLRGKLLLIVGELDTNVPPESTIRFADALIRARKDFEFLLVPNENHGTRGPAGSYVDRRMQDFFVRHLMGVEPPDRNGEEIEAPAGS